MPLQKEMQELLDLETRNYADTIIKDRHISFLFILLTKPHSG